MTNKEELENLEKLLEVWSQLKPWQRKWLRIQGEVVYIVISFVNTIYRVDLWLFPPAAFFAAYNLASQHFPYHPVKMIAVLSTASMLAALVLLILRPRRRRHWGRS